LKCRENAQEDLKNHYEETKYERALSLKEAAQEKFTIFLNAIKKV